jgi:hypothetical protein
MFTFHNDVFILHSFQNTLTRWRDGVHLDSEYDLSDISTNLKEIYVAIAGHGQIVAYDGQTLYRVTPTKNTVLKKLDLDSGKVDVMKFTSDKTLVIQTTSVIFKGTFHTTHEVRGIFDPPARVLREVSVGTGIDPGSMSVIAQYI